MKVHVHVHCSIFKQVVSKIDVLMRTPFKQWHLHVALNKLEFTLDTRRASWQRGSESQYTCALGIT